VRIFNRQGLVQQRHRVIAVVSLVGVGVGMATFGAGPASADSTFTCPGGTYEGLRYQYDPAVAVVEVGNWSALWVGVGLVGGGHVLYGDGSTLMNNAVLNVLVDRGVNATDAHICKKDPNATTTTTVPVTTSTVPVTTTTVPVTTTTVPVTTTTVPVTTTTVPVTTTTVPVTTTTVPVTTTTVPVTTTTVPVTTTTVPVTTTTVPDTTTTVPATTTTTVPATTTTVPATTTTVLATTTTEVSSGGPTTTVSATTTTDVDSFPAIPTTLPAPSATPPVTGLPATGSGSSNLTLGLGAGLLMAGALLAFGARRRTTQS
jgi:LPXTG-motif cell wall-anchored protein